MCSCLPPTKSLLNTLLPGYAGTRNQRFWVPVLPPAPRPTIIDKQCTFEMVNRGVGNLSCHPILTSKSLISHVLGANSQNLHTSKISFGFWVLDSYALLNGRNCHSSSFSSFEFHSNILKTLWFSLFRLPIYSHHSPFSN